MTKKLSKAFDRILPDRSNVRILEQNSALLSDWAGSLGWMQIVEVKHAPEPGMELGYCFENVSRKMQSAGGSALHGRMFIETVGQAIQTEAHAVWVSPEGEPVNITP